jgi:hypothetical protein
MICPTCHGAGEILINARREIVHRIEDAVMSLPCTAGCIGGVFHCCDGDQACNDAEQPLLAAKEEHTP